MNKKLTQAKILKGYVGPQKTPSISVGNKY